MVKQFFIGIENSTRGMDHFFLAHCDFSEALRLSLRVRFFWQRLTIKARQQNLFFFYIIRNIWYVV